MLKLRKKISKEEYGYIREMSKIVNKWMNDCLRPEFDSLYEYNKDKEDWLKRFLIPILWTSGRSI